MRSMHSMLLAGAALLAAGTATAAAAEKLHTMQVALPDGSTAHIEYTGNVVPKVTIEPVEARTRVVFNPFAELDRMAIAMQARHQAMMRQLAAMQQAAIAGGSAAAPGQLTVVGNLPAGAHYSYYSSTTDARGCTQTVQYSSNGSGTEPKVTRASAGNCDAASSEAGPTTVAAPAPAPRKLDNKDV